MKGLLEALGFLSTIPLPGGPPKPPFRTMAAYPWAGLILGCAAATAAWGVSFIFGTAGTAVVVTSLRIGLTGGLHLDGLADLADGWGGGKDPERRLAIMADSRLGSFGALALLVVVPLQTVTIAEILQMGNSASNWTDYLFLAVVPAVSRGLLPLIIRLHPSARPGGLGDQNRKAASVTVVAFTMISAFFIVGCVFGVGGIIAAAGTLAFMTMGSYRIARGLGGLTGDVYGALIETGEVVFLVGLLVIQRFDFLAQGIFA